MTLCIGINLGDNIIIGADSRKIIQPGGNHSDDYQKVLPIHDTLWSAGAGNVAITRYLQDLIAEFTPKNVMMYLMLLTPMVKKIYEAHKEIHVRLAHEVPFLKNYTLPVALIIGGCDQPTSHMNLWSLSSEDDFTPQERSSALVGGTPEDRQIANEIISQVIESTGEKSAPLAIQCAIQAVSQRNPQIGPHGHVVLIDREGYKMHQF